MSQAPLSLAPQGDFRLYLQRELVRRCQANPKYSLRAFARHLGLESSRLSKILRAERPVAPDLLMRLGQRLGLEPAEMEGFRKARIAEKYGPAAAEEPARQRDAFQLSLDHFETIQDWRHYLILELMKVEGFKPSVKWLARALGTTISETRAYIERLQRVGLLEISQPKGRKSPLWKDRSEGYSTHVLGDNITSYAHRRSQRRILEQAIEALESVPIERRDQSSLMMATHSSRIAEAKRRIRRFRRELCEFLEDCEVKDTVYQVSVSLFPLTEPEAKRRKKS